jgi:S-adenosylmethionine hydrolase
MNVPISFLSDFGRADEFVGVIHGVIARVAPEVRIVDVGHDFPRGDVRAAALGLLRAIQYLPQGVALAVVDPGVGTERRALAARTEWGTMIGPDNGLLAPAVAMVGGADLIVAIENPELRLPAEGATFAGRDVFAPAAAVVASGQATVEQLGPEVDPDTVVPLMLPLVEHDAATLHGEILWIDHFGNAQTNVSPGDLEAAGVTPGSEVVVGIGSVEYHLVWVATYGEVEAGEGLLHVDSYGQIALAVREGRADDAFPIGVGTTLTMRGPGTPAAELQSPSAS